MRPHAQGRKTRAHHSHGADAAWCCLHRHGTQAWQVRSVYV